MSREGILAGIWILVAISAPWAAAAVVDFQGASGGGGQGRGRPLADWQLVRSQEFTVAPNSSAELIANCPRGSVPLGGGFSKVPSTPDSPPGVEIASSFPAFFTFQGQTISGWIAHVVNRSTDDALVTVWAVCARR